MLAGTAWTAQAPLGITVTCSHPGKSSKCYQNATTHQGTVSVTHTDARMGCLETLSQAVVIVPSSFVWCPLKYPVQGHVRKKIKRGSSEVKRVFQNRRGWILRSLVCNEWSRAQIPKCSFPYIVKENGSCVLIDQISLWNGLCTSSGTKATCWVLLGRLDNIPLSQLKQQWKFVEIQKQIFFKGIYLYSG